MGGCTHVCIYDSNCLGTEWLSFFVMAVSVICVCDVCHHLVLFAQYAADILPLAMFWLWRALNEARFFFMASDSPFLGLPAVLAPCSPKRIVLIWLPCLATTMWDFLGWLGVRLGLLYPLTPARASRGSFLAGITFSFCNWCVLEQCFFVRLFVPPLFWRRLYLLWCTDISYHQL